MENANKAYHLSAGKDSLVLDILAAAHAESGDFQKAREFEEKAIELTAEKDKSELRARLELYRQGKPCSSSEGRAKHPVASTSISESTKAVETAAMTDFDGLAVAPIDERAIERAIADLTNSIRLDPNNASSYYFRFSRSLRRRNLAAAIADFNGAIRLSPQDTKAY